jgi:hypothetical protein
MRFIVFEPDKLMWPGKYGLIGTQGDAEFEGIDFSKWEAAVGKSRRIVTVATGRKNEEMTYFFSSMCDLGRVEVVHQHGYIWPVNPPLSGRAIMEELAKHLNELHG